MAFVRRAQQCPFFWMESLFFWCFDGWWTWKITGKKLVKCIAKRKFHIPIIYKVETYQLLSGRLFFVSTILWPINCRNKHIIWKKSMTDSLTFHFWLQWLQFSSLTEAFISAMSKPQHVQSMQPKTPQPCLSCTSLSTTLGISRGTPKSGTSFP